YVAAIPARNRRRARNQLAGSSVGALAPLACVSTAGKYNRAPGAFEAAFARRAPLECVRCRREKDQDERPVVERHAQPPLRRSWRSEWRRKLPVFAEAWRTPRAPYAQ